MAGILVARPDQATVGRGRWPHATRETFAVFPTAARPRLVVPLASRRAAVAALGGSTYGRNPHVRLARALVRFGTRIGVAQYVFRDRLSIAGDEAGGKDLLSDVLLTDRLSEIFGRRDILVAVHVGPARPNRKPLVQVLSPDGEVLGYVKIGWNPLTRGLVRHEADVLAELEDRMRSVRILEAPRVLDSEEWRDLQILVLSPLRGRRLRTTRRHIAMAVSAMKEVSSLVVAEGERQLADSDFWLTERARLGEVPNSDRLAELADVVEARYGDHVLSFGSWHGDWAPWNMAVRGESLAVWDWERSGRGVPVGLDAAHFDFQIALADSRHRWNRALRRVLAAHAPMLSALALPEDRRRLLLSLHLLEMALRWEEGRRAGMSPPDSYFTPALEALLGRA